MRIWVSTKTSLNFAVKELRKLEIVDMIWSHTYKSAATVSYKSTQRNRIPLLLIATAKVNKAFLYVHNSILLLQFLIDVLTKRCKYWKHYMDTTTIAF